MTRCIFSPNGKRVVSVCNNGIARIWILEAEDFATIPASAVQVIEDEEGTVTLDEARRNSGLYIIKGNNFIPIKRQDIGNLSGPDNHYANILDATAQVHKIPNTAQLVLFGIEEISVDKILRTGYTIPCNVQFDQSDSPVRISYYNNVGGRFEKMNGENPLKYSPRLFMQTSQILEAKENEFFVFGRFENTEWKEYTLTANHRFFIYKAGYRDRDVERWNLGIERTRNGYFKVNFTQPPVGYCCINGSVIVEFVNVAEVKPDKTMSGGGIEQPAPKVPQVPQPGDRARQLFGTPKAP